ncbi:uncharacterized protein LOC120343268 isoform X1 [Styela clava]
MWGFQSIRDSVQNHATGLFRNISDRVDDDVTQNNMRVTQRDAMKNVVTPKSIPQFTLPPLFNHDSILPPAPEINHLQMESSKRRTRAGVKNGVSKCPDTQQCQNKMDTLKVSQWDHEIMDDMEVGDKDSSIRHRKPLGSASSFSIKALMQKKWADSKNGSTTSSTTSWKAPGPEYTSKAGNKCGRELTVEQPGLGLQHLVATKSGFSTLSESPNTRRKESLFLSEDTFRKCNDSYSNIHSRSRSPGSDGNNSSTRSSPRESPIPSPRKISSSKSERRHKYRKNLEVESQCQRRLSFHGDTNNHLLSSSDNDERSLSIDSDKKKLSVSEHNVSNKSVKSSHSPASPSIRLCITYLVQHRRLNVSILEGKNFTPKHSIYLKVSLLPRHDRGHRTEPIKIDDANPSIRERLTFESVEEDDIPHMSLKICCKEKSSRLRHAEIVGECILALCEIDFKTPTDIWINFNSYEEEEAPHIQLSLCYDAMLGCLTVDVVAARNVPKGSLGRQPDCFVTLTEILPNVKIAKKQTKIVHRTQDPVFHESFLFSLCTDAQTPDELVIVATLYLKDRVRGTTEPVGEALLGQLVDNWSGRSQWAQALAKEGEATTHWHALVPQSA